LVYNFLKKKTLWSFSEKKRLLVTGDCCPTFRDSAVLSSSRFEMSNAEHRRWKREYIMAVRPVTGEKKGKSGFYFYPAGTGGPFIRSRVKEMAGETDLSSPRKAEFVNSLSCTPTPVGLYDVAHITHRNNFTFT
jgi:hypothetical protein